ncbi:MAG: YqgE/AlgH family protein [Lacibacter sp.]
MQLQNGVFLKSTSLLNNTVFENCVVFIAEYNSKGALGFVINKQYGRLLNELEEFKQSAGFPLYEGGPVDHQHLYFVHMRPDVIEEGTAVGNGLYLGGNFQQAVEAVNNGIITQSHLKIFVGYTGWDTGDLEAEIEEGSWLVLPEASKDVFMT